MDAVLIVVVATSQSRKSARLNSVLILNRLAIAPEETLGIPDNVGTID